MSFAQKKSNTKLCTGPAILDRTKGEFIARSPSERTTSHLTAICARQYNNKATALPSSALRPHSNSASINRLLLATGGVAPHSPALPKPGQSLTAKQRLLLALHQSASRPSGNKTVAAAKRRQPEERRVGLLRKRGSAERRTAVAERRLAAATARTSAAEPEARERNSAYSRRPTTPTDQLGVFPTARTKWLSATCRLLLALAIAQGVLLAATTVGSTQSLGLAPVLAASQPDRPPTRLRSSHCTTVDDDLAESHRWDDPDLQCRLASRTHPNTVDHELLLEAQRKFAGGVGSEYGVQWAKLKASRGIDKTLSLAICGDYPRREDLTRCDYLSFKCRDRLLCPHCCYRFLGGPLVDEFGDVALAGMQAFYICISLSANPDEAARFKFRDFERADRDEVKGTRLATPCDPDNYGIPFQTEVDVEQCRLIWKLIAEAIHEFTGTGRHQRFLGVVGGPELSVQFQPLRVIPHCNFVVFTNSFTIDDARELRRLIRAKCRNCRPLKLKLFPSVACYRLRTRDDLRAVLLYSMKPVDLSGAYTKAAERVNYQPAVVMALNADVKVFLHRLPEVFCGLPRITRHGVCHPNARGYIGHTTDYRAARRERDADRRRALRQNGSLARRNAKQSVAPAKPKSRRSRITRFAYWRRAVMPGPPPMPPRQRGIAPPPFSPATVGCDAVNTERKTENHRV